MKIPSKIYAEFMLDGVSGKTDAQSVQFIKKFVKNLAANHGLSKEKEIINFFSSLWNEKNKVVEVNVASAGKVDKKNLSLIEEKVKSETGAKKVVINEKINKNMLGGFVLEYGDEVIDNSLRTKLNNLKRAIIK